MYVLETRMRTTPLDRMLGIIDPWSEIDASHDKATMESVMRELRALDKQYGIDLEWHYRVRFVSVN